MLVAEPTDTTRLRNQPPEIMPGSPTAILAIFTEIVRERFRPGNDLPWVWDGSASPRNGDAGTASSPRKILIEPAYSETAEVRNFRPAIYVDKGPTQPGKIAVANLAGEYIPKNLRAFYTLATIPINITVEASRKGESSVIADTVWFYLLGGIEQIRRTFDVHDITLPQLGTTVPVEKDKATWVTQISFAITVHLRWTTIPIAPVLTGFSTTIKAATGVTVDNNPSGSEQTTLIES